MGHSKAMVLSHDAEWRWHVRADMPPPRVGEVTHLLKPHGECVLTILTSQQSVWLHTKDFYPAGCYRLPTGGIKPEEHPDGAARRELREEVGCAGSCRILRLGKITYVEASGTAYPFVSYLYQVAPVEKTPTSADESERISGWKTVPISHLGAVASELRALPAEWVDWGCFRAVAHDAVREILRREAQSPACEGT
ncbi:MAG TPA: NUDIX hydrolase [Candidatus Latescibacteria bacterium]|nr:NUDIX hydrolase [Candidatus Latescibacterota bacterium]